MGDNLADLAGTGEEDVVQRQLEKAGHLGGGADDDAVAGGVKVLGEQLSQEVGQVDSLLGWLEDGSISSGDRGEEWTE